VDWTSPRSRVLLAAWIALAAVLLALDHEIGPGIQFPVFFLVPVLLAAWFNGLAWGLAFAAVLALARLGFRMAGWEAPWSLFDTFVNAGIRLLVFSMAAFMADRIAAQRRLLGRRLDLVLETLPVGVWITDALGNLASSNPAARAIWGGERRVGPEGYGAYRGWWADSGTPIAAEEWALARAIRNGETSIGELVEIEGFDGVRRTIRNSAAPLRDERGRILGAVVLNVDITRQALAAKEREELVARLQEALEQVKTLGGLIPICAGCKKIRNDSGYWIRLETYLKEHSDADFSHGLCPECLEHLYPDFLE
jgi:PAS domain-containing protein